MSEGHEYEALFVEQSPPFPQEVDEVHCSRENHHQVVAVHDEECRTFALSNRLPRLHAYVVESNEEAPGELALAAYLAVKYEQLTVTDRLTLPLSLDEVDAVIELEGPDKTHTEVADTPVMASYEAQADRFLSWIADGVAPPVDGETGAASVRYVDAVRAAALSGASL